MVEAQDGIDLRGLQPAPAHRAPCIQVNPADRRRAETGRPTVRIEFGEHVPHMAQGLGERRPSQFSDRLGAAIGHGRQVRAPRRSALHRLIEFELVARPGDQLVD